MTRRSTRGGLAKQSAESNDIVPPLVNWPLLLASNMFVDRADPEASSFSTL